MPREKVCYTNERSILRRYKSNGHKSVGLYMVYEGTRQIIVYDVGK